MTLCRDYYDAVVVGAAVAGEAKTLPGNNRAKAALVCEFAPYNAALSFGGGGHADFFGHAGAYQVGRSNHL